MKFANKVQKPFVYTPSAKMLADPNYLRNKFQQIRKRQEEEAKAKQERDNKVRKLR